MNAKLQRASPANLRPREGGCELPEYRQPSTPTAPSPTGATLGHIPVHIHLTPLQSLGGWLWAWVCKGKGRQEASRERRFQLSFTLYLKFYMPPAYRKVAHSELDSLLEQRARCKHKCQTSAQMEEPKPSGPLIFGTRGTRGVRGEPTALRVTSLRAHGRALGLLS